MILRKKQPNRTTICTALFLLSLGRLVRTNETTTESSVKGVGTLRIPAIAPTRGFLFQHTNYRIKDPRISLPFYTGVLGMTQLTQLNIPGARYTLFLLGSGNDMPNISFIQIVPGMKQMSMLYPTGNVSHFNLTRYENPISIPKDQKRRTRWAMSRRGALELEHHWDSENDANISYHNGNSNPYGYGHIGINVPDVYVACKRFEELRVEFAKRPDEGLLKGIAFIKDPDGYWIAIFNHNAVAESEQIISLV